MSISFQLAKLFAFIKLQIVYQKLENKYKDNIFSKKKGESK